MAALAKIKARRYTHFFKYLSMGAKDLTASDECSNENCWCVLPLRAS
jgi:hypothetical protein